MDYKKDRGAFVSDCQNAIPNFLIASPTGMKYYNNQLCYMRLFKNYSEAAIEEGEQVFLFFPKYLYKDYGMREYLDYIVNESVFKDAHLTKDVEEGMQYGFEIDVSKPVEYLKPGAIALRRAFEITGNSKAFSLLVNGGVMSKEDAYIAVQQVSFHHRAYKTPCMYPKFSHEHDPIPHMYEYGVYKGDYYSPKHPNITLFCQESYTPKSWPAWTGDAKRAPFIEGRYPPGIKIQGKAVSMSFTEYNEEDLVNILNHTKGLS